MVDFHQRVTAGQSQTYSQRKFYNGLGQLIQVQTPRAALTSGTKDVVVDYAYDAYGQVSQQTMALRTWPDWYERHAGEPTPWRGQQLTQPSTRSTYDVLSRALARHCPGQYLFREPVHRSQVRMSDPRGKYTYQTLDVWGRTTLVDPPDGPSVSYTYNEADQLPRAVNTAQPPPRLPTIWLGGKTQMNDADMGLWNYSYDAVGNLTRQTDARGQRICLYYDNANRPLGKHYRSDDNCPTSPSYNVRYYYDEGGAAAYAYGRRTRMTDASGSSTWSYDSRGRRTQESKAVTGVGTFVTQWSYNSADQVVWMKYPGGSGSQIGEQVNYTYHPQAVLNSVTGATTYVPATQYNAAGQIELRKFGGTSASPILQTDYAYFAWDTANGQGRLKQITSGTPASPTSLQDLRYYSGTNTPIYDQAGNILNIYDWKAGSPQTQAFSYDDLNRLVSASASGGTGGLYSESYSYHPDTGNLYTKSSLGTYTYTASHTHAVASISNGWSFQYDANGNMTQRVTGSTYNLGYDAENRLTSVSGAATATFAYDGDGKRVKATVGGVTTTYIGSYAEWSGTTLTKYYYADGQRVAMRAGSTLYFIFGDHLGSTSRVATSTGSTRSSELRYRAWVKRVYSSGTPPTRYTYTGQYSYVADFGLMYYGARRFDVQLGLFAQADSIVPEATQGVQAWNR